jgi:hypothetical protein
MSADPRFEKLGRWAKVALAARSVKRGIALLRQRRSKLPNDYWEAVESARAAAEDSAANGKANDGLQNICLHAHQVAAYGVPARFRSPSAGPGVFNPLEHAVSLLPHAAAFAAASAEKETFASAAVFEVIFIARSINAHDLLAGIESDIARLEHLAGTGPADQPFAPEALDPLPNDKPQPNARKRKDQTEIGGTTQ